MIILNQKLPNTSLTASSSPNPAHTKIKVELKLPGATHTRFVSSLDEAIEVGNKFEAATCAEDLWKLVAFA